MRRFVLLLPLIFLGAANSISDEQIAEANGFYNYDVDMLTVMEPQYASHANFRELENKVPLIFIPLLKQLADHPTKAAKNDFLTKVGLLDGCAASLYEKVTFDLPPACTQLLKTLSPQEEAADNEEIEDEENDPDAS